jgi:DNA-binding CsgD family transcriptional regulator
MAGLGFEVEDQLHCQQLDNRYGLIELLADLVRGTPREGNQEAAAPLLVVIYAVRKRQDVRELPAEQAASNAQTGEMRYQLGDVTFTPTRVTVQVVILEQAYDFAVSQSVPAGAAPCLVPETVPVHLPSERQAAKQQYGGLTARERQVAALIAQGKSNQKIADELVVVLKTVEAHITHILDKLGFTSRAQIATWAVSKGLAEAPRDLDTLVREDLAAVGDRGIPNGHA